MSNARRGRVYKDGKFTSGENKGDDRWAFVVDIQPPGAKRKQVRRRGFATRKAAADELNRIARAGADGVHVDPKTTTLREYVGKWLTAREMDRRATTVESYRRLLGTHVLPTLGDHRLQDITAEDLDGLYATLLKSGRRRGVAGHGEGLSPRTVRIVATVVGRVLADAKRKGTIARNVAPLADAPSGEAVRAPEPTVWDLDTTRAFLDHPVVRDHELFPAFWLAAVTGMRRGEVAGLRWSDVDLETGIIAVEQAATAVRADDIRLGALKTRKARRLVTGLGPATVEVLADHRARQAAQRDALGAGWRGDAYDLVFPVVDGTPRTPNTITARWNRLVARTGFPPVRFHDLRHGHATHRAAEGEHPHTTAERLGHASAAFTLDRYTHSTAGAQDRVQAAIEARLTGSRNPLQLVEDTADEVSKGQDDAALGGEGAS